MRATLLRRSVLPPTIRQLLLPIPPSQLSSQDAEKPVTVTGFVKSIRRQKRVSFAVVSDGSNAKGMQAVFLDTPVPKDLTNGASVRLTGKLSKSPGAGQEKELIVNGVEVLGACDPETYPIQKQTLSNEFLRDNVHLRARAGSIAAMIRMRHALQRELESWFDKHDFYHVNTPILTSNDAEGAGETFKISTTTEEAPISAPEESHQKEEHFFGTPAHLTVSAQLHLEAFQHAISRMWTLSPAFRAERSDTSRHLAEFWMLEAEWGDVSPSASTPGGVRGICAFVEGMLRHTVRGLLERDRTKEDLDVLSDGNSRQSERREQIHKAVYSPEPWTVMTYTEAIEHLRGSGQTFEFEPVWGKSLQSEHEKWLAEKMVGGPVFVVDYPVGLKPFYMRLNSAAEGQEGTVACFDLLVPGVGELVGGSVREEREEVLIKRMRECGLLEDTGELGAYQWYLDLRKYGGAPHIGFGMGFERLVSWVGGVENVKECVPVPRWAGRMML